MIEPGQTYIDPHGREVIVIEQMSDLWVFDGEPAQYLVRFVNPEHGSVARATADQLRPVIAPGDLVKHTITPFFYSVLETIENAKLDTPLKHIPLSETVALVRHTTSGGVGWIPARNLELLQRASDASL